MRRGIVQCEFVYRLCLSGPYFKNWLCQLAFCEIQVLQLSSNNSPNLTCKTNQSSPGNPTTSHSFHRACTFIYLLKDSCLIWTHLKPKQLWGIQPKCRPNFQRPRSTVAKRWRSTAPQQLLASRATMISDRLRIKTSQRSALLQCTSSSHVHSMRYLTEHESHM